MASIIIMYKVILYTRLNQKQVPYNSPVSCPFLWSMTAAMADVLWMTTIVVVVSSPDTSAEVGGAVGRAIKVAIARSVVTQTEGATGRYSTNFGCKKMRKRTIKRGERIDG